MPSLDFFGSLVFCEVLSGDYVPVDLRLYPELLLYLSKDCYLPLGGVTIMELKGLTFDPSLV